MHTSSPLISQLKFLRRITKTDFYSELIEILSDIDPRDEVRLLGDFNARLGTRRDLLGGATCRLGVGKMNVNGLQLLTLCAEFNLAITNILSKLKIVHKTSLLEPHSKQ